MAWTVPNGCYYAVRILSGATTQWVYYNAGSSVPNDRAPNKSTGIIPMFVLMDFNNGYFYSTLVMLSLVDASSYGGQATINVNSNNSFTITTTGLLLSSTYVNVYASNEQCPERGFILTGTPFTFGDGTGLFDKTDFLRNEYGVDSNSPVYTMDQSFMGRTDITSVEIPDGIEMLYSCFSGCTSLETVTGSLDHLTQAGNAFENCVNLTSVPDFPNVAYDSSWYITFERCFYNCSSMVDFPEMPSNTVDMDRCFYGCTSMVIAPAIPASVGWEDEDAEEYGGVNECFKGCTSLVNAPSILSNNLKSLRETFYGCSSLVSPPDISNATNIKIMDGCFQGCTSLAGIIEVNNTPTSYSNIFSQTTNNIYIMNGGSAGSIWKNTIALSYSNVHYEFDDNPLPSLSNFSLTRVASSGSKEYSEMGEYVYLKTNFSIFADYIPSGYTNSLKSFNLLIDGSAPQTQPTWTETSPQTTPPTVEAWYNINNTTLNHTFELTVSDSIQLNNVEKKSRTSSPLSLILQKVYALFDIMHDDANNVEGLAIGGYATLPGTLEVGIPSQFYESLEKPDMTQAELSAFLSTITNKQVDYIVEQGTSGNWTYRKWNSGVAECWRYDSRSWTINQTYGSLYFAGISAGTFTFPSNLFIAAPILLASRAQQADASGFGLPSIIEVTKNGFRGYVVDAVSGTKTIGLAFYAKGKWK